MKRMIHPILPPSSWPLLDRIYAKIALTCIIYSVFDICAWATPPIDADSNWGRGAQLSLSNPAAISSAHSALTLTYDLIIPQLDQILDPSQSYNIRDSWGHELYLGTSLSDSYSFALGYIYFPFTESDGSSFSRHKAWSFAQALQVSSRLSIGLTYIKNHNSHAWLSGFTYGLTPWLLTSMTVIGSPLSSYTNGMLEFGVGLKPFDPLLIGLSSRPSKGGGLAKVSTQLDLWRGFCLEMSWLYDQVNRDALNGLLPAYHNLLNDEESDPHHLFSLALSWKGKAGWRMESGFSKHQPARMGLRLGTQTIKKYETRSEQLLHIVNARDAREVAFKSSLLGQPEGYSPFFNTLEQLQSLKQTENLKVALLLLGGPLGYAQAEELIESIKQLRLRGVIVYAYLPQANLANYLVAASCDIVWASPTAELAITGLLSERLYFRKALDRFNIIPEILTVGDFKSAPEVFEREGPSQASKLMDKRLLDARFSRIVALLAHRAQQQRWAKEPSPSLTKGKRLIALRKLRDKDPLNREDKALAITWLNEGPYSAQNALKNGLIDKVVSPTSLEEYLKKIHPNLVLRNHLNSSDQRPWAPLPEIAVIHAAGEIGNSSPLGNGSPRISAATYIPLIKQVTYDPKVKAVVLRIDSPGGTVNDADALWVALQDLAKRKPLAVSMGNIAASGGYYIAAPAQKIFVSPSTLTGSIGVFAGKVDLSGLLDDFGISVYRQERGHSVSNSFFTPWSDQARKTLIKELHNIYELFLSRITSSRSVLSKDNLLPLAGGRVWTGLEALSNGLVDIQGGLIDAIAWVSAEASLGHKPHKIRSLFPRKPSVLSRALGMLAIGQNTSILDLNHGSERAISSLSPLLNTVFQQLPTVVRFTLSQMSSTTTVPLAIDPRW